MHVVAGATLSVTDCGDTVLFVTTLGAFKGKSGTGAWQPVRVRTLSSNSSISVIFQRSFTSAESGLEDDTDLLHLGRVQMEGTREKRARRRMYYYCSHSRQASARDVDDENDEEKDVMIGKTTTMTTVRMKKNDSDDGSR
jgi:hypothetical protein